MKKHLMFYVALVVLVTLDAVLLTSPNLLGRIGIIIYKYHYLRSFPRAFVTVACVALVALGMAELVRLLVNRNSIRRVAGVSILMALVLACAALLAKTWMDFSTGMYSHTGIRFRYGAYLLPAILLSIFLHALGNLRWSGRSEAPPEPRNVDDHDTTTQ
jgi:hypothetical protein